MKIPITAQSSISPLLVCWGPCSRTLMPAYFTIIRGEPYGRDWVCKECRSKGAKGPATEFNSRRPKRKRK